MVEFSQEQQVLFGRFIESESPVADVLDAGSIGEAQSVLEGKLFLLGVLLAKEGIPLGFINSYGLNRSFTDFLSSDSSISSLLNTLRGSLYRRAFIDSRLDPMGSYSGVIQDLVLTNWLMDFTLCYVCTSSVSDTLDAFNTDEVTVGCYTFSRPLMERVLGSSIEGRLDVRYKRCLDDRVVNLSEYALRAPRVLLGSKGKVTIPNSYINFGSLEYSVIPVSIVSGYISELRRRSCDCLTVIDSRVLGGSMRRFYITSDYNLAGYLYNSDTQFIFDGYRSQPDRLSYMQAGSGGLVVYEGVGSMNFIDCELGVEVGSHPKRTVNLARIHRIGYIDASSLSADSPEILKLAEYSTVNWSRLYDKVVGATASWDKDRLYSFYVGLVDYIFSELGYRFDLGFSSVTGHTDFAFKLGSFYDKYSVMFERILYDYVKGIPEIGGYSISESHSIDGQVIDHLFSEATGLELSDLPF